VTPLKKFLVHIASNVSDLNIYKTCIYTTLTETVFPCFALNCKRS